MHDQNETPPLPPPLINDDQVQVKELLVIGAGPHSLALMLRLLESNPDFMSEKERHAKAETSKKLRPARDVRRHMSKVAKGPAHILKRSRKSTKNKDTSPPPPLSLEDVQNSVVVVDAFGEWLTTWNDNFEGLRIPRLRSVMHAHADPFDHRSMEQYAEMYGRSEELITLKELFQRDKKFNGPYQVPSTSLFKDFHDTLIKGYGVKDIVQKGYVESITPIKHKNDDEPIFEVRIKDINGNMQDMKTKRVVCAMGPNFSTRLASWEASLMQSFQDQNLNYSHKILHANEIVPWLKIKEKYAKRNANTRTLRLMIVGGGITSVQLALLAEKSPWCKHVSLIQRSKTLPRQFDVENEWMGSGRGKLLEEFWCLDMENRVRRLREARKGGSVPPEVLTELHEKANRRHSKLCIQEEIEISQVCWRDNSLMATLDDASEVYCDMIWLATGSENHIDRYPCMHRLREVLNIQTVHGLPVLNHDLSFKSLDEEEPAWKQLARKRVHMIGVLGSLELGPDALNLVGARHGAVRVAQVIRKQMMCTKPVLS